MIFDNSKSNQPAALSVESVAGPSSQPERPAATAPPYTVAAVASDGQSYQSQTFTWLISAISFTNPGDQTTSTATTSTSRRPSPIPPAEHAGIFGLRLPSRAGH